ncbi:MAG: hypothetical protein ACHQ0Y_00880 [Thermodesulfovibrionales bacterium]
MRLEYLVKGGSNIRLRLAGMVPGFGVFMVLALVIATSAFADVSLTDRKSYAKQMKDQGGNVGIPPKATGSKTLIDGSGLKWFINDNITFNTTSSASGAMMEASYVAPVSATTANGGHVSATLNDAFDGYNTICLSLNNTVAQCATGNANFIFYNKNGASTVDQTCANNRQIIFNPQTIGNLTVSRKVFVPDNDSFARWQNIVTNTGVTPQTVTLITANNLGSDSNTIITGTSSGNNTAEVTDTWVTTMQNFVSPATTSTDPRLGHVLQSTGASVGLAGIHFANGSDRPYWGYTFTLAPGETKIIMNFATGQPSKAAAAAKSAELANLTNPNALACMSVTDKSRVANFSVEPPKPVSIPAMGQWGMIIFVILSGLGSLYYFRRQKSRG